MDPADFFQECVLSTVVVTDKIFSYLTKYELLGCALVSKKWISPSREFLRRFHFCRLKLKPSEFGNLESASRLLENSVAIMFNEVYIQLSPIWRVNGGQQNFNGNFQQMLQRVFERIPNIKLVTLSVNSMQNPNHGNEIIVRLVMELLPIEEIEELRILGILKDLEPLILNKRIFSHLKVAEIESSAHPAGISKFLEHCPILQKWTEIVDVADIPNFIVANKSFLVKRLCISNGITPELLEDIRVAEVTLTEIRVQLDPNLALVDIIRRIIISTVSSLEEVELSLWFYWQLMSELPRLSKVRRLVIHQHDTFEYDEEWNLFDRDFGIDEDIIYGSDTRCVFPSATIEFRKWKEHDNYFSPV